MSGDSVLKAKEMLQQLAACCKDYRKFENAVATAKRNLTNSQKKKETLKGEIDELEKLFDNLVPVDLDVLNQEIADLNDEKSKLGFFAIIKLGKINSQLKRKNDELAEGIYKNETLAEIEKKKKEYAVVCKTEEKKQQEYQIIIEKNSEGISKISELINTCANAFSQIPDEALFYLVQEAGPEMEYLPNVILKRVVSVGVPGFIKNMTVQNQVKLLYPYDTPIHFGGREWNVLEIKKDRALLLLKGPYTCSKYYRAKYAWEEKTRHANAFHRGESKRLKWENSEARKILNNEFITSLHVKENEKILNGYKHDKVFCLSKQEVEKYLNFNQRTIDGAWWLRDTSYYEGNKAYGIEPDATSQVAYVDLFGKIDKNYNNWEITQDSPIKNMCFRPALWVELPYDSLDIEWNEQNRNIICRGKWTVENCYSHITVDLDAVAKRFNETYNGPKKDELPDFIVVPRIDVSDM